MTAPCFSTHHTIRGKLLSAVSEQSHLVNSKLKVRHSSTSTEISAIEALGTLVPFSPIKPTSERRTTTKSPFRLPPLPLVLSTPASDPLSVLPSQKSPPARQMHLSRSQYWWGLRPQCTGPPRLQDKLMETAVHLLCDDNNSGSSAAPGP